MVTAIPHSLYCFCTLMRILRRTCAFSTVPNQREFVGMQKFRTARYEIICENHTYAWTVLKNSESSFCPTVSYDLKCSISDDTNLVPKRDKTWSWIQVGHTERTYFELEDTRILKFGENCPCPSAIEQCACCSSEGHTGVCRKVVTLEKWLYRIIHDLSLFFDRLRA